MGQKILLTCFLSLLFVGVYGQSQSTFEAAIRHLEKNADQIGITKSDYEDALVSTQYTHPKTGATYIYLNQAYQGIKLKNGIMTIVVKDGEVINIASNFTPDLASIVKNVDTSIKPSDAVVKAANHLGVFRPEAPEAKSRTDKGVLKYDQTSYTNSDILVEKMFDLSGDSPALVWQATLDLKMNADYWEIRMDANTGEFVSKNNLTVYCKHEKGQYANHDKCAASTISNSMAHTQTISEATAMMAGSYNVFPLPSESPAHGNQELVADPALPSSPFGWHDWDGVDGPESTTTQGNNVFAFTDKDGDNSPDGDVTLPEGGDALLFDFPQNPDSSALSNLNASVVNLFYMNNMMHDISALMGFDEVSGNFQRTNYTGEGAGGDFVLAQAFDGFELPDPSLNNANFATPADGSSGAMQMFLWTSASGNVFIDFPSQLSGFVEHSSANGWGGAIPAAGEDPITGLLELVNDGNPANPTTGCREIENDLTDKIALIDRGLCDFSLKAFNAESKGAIAVVICNIAGVNGGDGEGFINMGAGDQAQFVTIPAIFIRKSDCDRIKLSMDANIDVQLTFQESEDTGPAFLDGSLDNGIIAHEFGHGISNRLTGGPFASGCLGNDEQMGEGWSDYFSLAYTVEPGDTGEDARGIGTYATGEPVDGRGIRRFPYSTDMNVNPQTFDDIKGTTAPHPLGEVWTSCLWDLHWRMIDLYGWDADWTNLESGNARAVRLVIEGMRVQGCEPGFVEGRDGIIAADRILFDGEHECLISEVFARRGVGYFADGGSTNDRNDGTEDFEPIPTCIEGLKIKKSATGFVDPGENISVTLVATNHIQIPSTLTGVTVTDELPDGLTLVDGSASMTATVNGNVISFDLGDMAYEDEVTITYEVQTDVTIKSSSLNFWDFEDGGADWEIVQNRGFTSWTESFDAFKSEETSFHIREAEEENDHSLVSPEFTVSGTAPALKFWHRYDTQAGTDGGFVQVSTDGGTIWDFNSQANFIRGEYSSVIGYSTLAIPSLEGFTGSSNGEFVDSYLDLSAYAGQDIKVRFRYGSDETVTSGVDIFGGWFVDDVELIDVFKYTASACIQESTGSFNACAEATQTLVNSDVASSSKDIPNDHFGVTISPNPAGDFVHILASSKVNEVAGLTITSIDGKIVYNSSIKVGPEVNRTSIDISDLSSGFYVVKIHSGENQFSQKLIKQ